MKEKVWEYLTAPAVITNFENLLLFAVLVALTAQAVYR